MAGGSESEGSEFEPVDPFDSGRDGAADGGEAEAASGDESERPAPALSDIPGLMRASDLLPPAIEDDGAEVPPTPEEADLQSLPLAFRERIKLARMSPEQKARYDAANAEIMANPAVAAFAAEEERIVASKADMSAAFVAAYRKKAKEKP